MADLASHKLSIALIATFSKIGSPVSLVRALNSMRKVPTPAVQVTVVSPFGTPYLRLTVPYGMPVGVLKAVDTQNTNMLKSLFSGASYLGSVVHSINNLMRLLRGQLVT